MALVAVALERRDQELLLETSPNCRRRGVRVTQQWCVRVEFAKVGEDIFAGNVNEYVNKLAEFIND